MSRRDAVVAQARTVLGVKFRHQGRVPERGLDCAGLVVWTFTSLGYSVEDCTCYARRPEPEQVRMEMLRSFESIALTEVKPGDVYSLRVAPGGPALHLAIATETGLIHASGLSRKVIEHRLDPYWADCLVEAYRIPGIEHT